jgi:hypothetical protein
MKKAIQIDMNDNVATVTTDVEIGDNIEVLSPDGKTVLTIKPIEIIKLGHKIALKQFKKGDPIIKYGEVIGNASEPIRVGYWVHTQNVESGHLPTNKVGILND